MRHAVDSQSAQYSLLYVACYSFKRMCAANLFSAHVACLLCNVLYCLMFSGAHQEAVGSPTGFRGSKAISKRLYPTRPLGEDEARNA